MESIYCQWSEAGNVWRCTQCGATVMKSAVMARPFAACRVGASANGVPFRTMARAKRERSTNPQLLTGPGTELKRLIKKIGLRDRPGCACNNRAMQMNMWGADECERQLETIVGWLREEAKRRKLPFVDAVARALVRRAIKNHRRKNAKDVQF